MKKNRLFWGTLILCFISTTLSAQKFEISFLHDQPQYDSLYLQAYNGTKFVSLYSCSNSPTTVFKAKDKLQCGQYQIVGDSVPLVQFLISNSKKEIKMKIFLNGDSISFENSNENNAYITFNRELSEFQKKMNRIEKEFTDAKKSSMPDYMLQTMADNLIKKAQESEKKHREFQEEMIKENEGTLLASIVKISMEIPTPPPSFYQNRELLQSYYTEHLFDNYNFDDERLAYTPLTSEKIKEFARLLYQFEREQDGIPYLNSLLTNMKRHTSTYYLFFDQLEKILGNYVSPFYTETIYITMLKDALSLPDLEAIRKTRYSKELKKLNKNLQGDIVPNFDIKLPNDSLTTLYDFKANYLILYFQNPDCPSCIEMRNRMAKMSVLNQAIDDRKVTVLTVYFEESEEVWKQYLNKDANPRYVNAWNYKYNIDSDELYDLRRIPYVFLLDKDKRVIKKDLLVNEIEYYIKRLK